MNFVDSIKICFSKYVDFSGRAKRPEFWWFTLFLFLANLVLGMLGDMISMLFSLATLLPSLSVGARRLHDTNRSGWWQLLWLIPVIGWIVMIVFLVQEGEAGDNRFGNAPLHSPCRCRLGGSYRNRNAFNTTISELTDMPIAASQGEISPAAANGSANRL